MWELERVPEEPVLSKEDQIAMDHFNETHSRQSDGRYVVRLPRLNPTPKLGTSRPAAVRRLVQSERSLEKKDLLSKFREVLEEYRTLNHAELVPHSQLSRPNFYLPVQVVTKNPPLPNSGQYSMLQLGPQQAYHSTTACSRGPAYTQTW